MERPVMMGALWRWMWQLACALLVLAALAGAQDSKVTGIPFESNKTVGDMSMDIKLQDSDGRTNLSSLVAITEKAARQVVSTRPSLSPREG